MIELNIKRGSNQRTITIEESHSVYDLKLRLFELFEIAPNDQRILGLSKTSHPPQDTVILSTLQLRNGQSLSLLDITPISAPPPIIPPPAFTPPSSADKLKELNDTITDLTQKMDVIEKDILPMIQVLEQGTERLTQTLIKLDAIEEESLRPMRREAVNKVTLLQERIDTLKAKLNKL